MRDTWMDDYEARQATTGFEQHSPSSSWFPETSPRRPDKVTSVTITQPETSSVVARGVELAGYAATVALNAIRGARNG